MQNKAKAEQDEEPPKEPRHRALLRAVFQFLWLGRLLV
jgi:hypothetical protein